MRASASRWREVGRELAARYAADGGTYAAHGLTSAESYRREWVRLAGVGPFAKRHIREGFRDAA